MWESIERASTYMKTTLEYKAQGNLTVTSFLLDFLTIQTYEVEDNIRYSLELHELTQ